MHTLISSCASCAQFGLTPLSGCNPAEVDLSLGNKPLVYFKAGSRMIGSGEPFRGVFCLKDGLVKITRQNADGSEKIMWLEGPGSMSGLDSFGNNQGYIFNVVALTDVEACFITEHDIRQLLVVSPSFIVPLMQRMCERINLVEERMLSASRRRMDEQLAGIIISLRDQMTHYQREIDFTVIDYASMLGTSHHYLYKVIAELSSQGFIQLQDHHIVVLNEAGLRRFLNEGGAYAG